MIITSYISYITLYHPSCRRSNSNDLDETTRGGEREEARRWIRWFDQVQLNHDDKSGGQLVSCVVLYTPRLITNSLNPRNRNSEYRFESHRGNLESFRPRHSLSLGICTYNYLDATQLESLTATLLQFLSLSFSALSLSLSLFPWLIIFAQIEYLTNVFLFFPRGKVGSFFRFSLF